MLLARGMNIWPLFQGLHDASDYRGEGTDVTSVQMSRQFTVNVVLTESEIVLLIQLLQKHILEKQWHDVTVQTPFETALLTKILKSRENSILEVKKARPR
jgi:hypothetical protein